MGAYRWGVQTIMRACEFMVPPSLRFIFVGLKEKVAQYYLVDCRW